MKILRIELSNVVKNISILTLIGIGLFVCLGTVTEASSFRASAKDVCADGGVLQVRCYAKVKTDKPGGKPVTTLVPDGYGPDQFHTAYNIPSNSLNPATIAVVVAYDHSRIKSDLDIYNKTYGLPTFPTCNSQITTSCFMKVNQDGSTKKFPRVDSGWALEAALDVETTHQVCPKCKLILVEANSNKYSDLMTAVDTARRLGAKVISNSYGSIEFSGEITYDSHFNYPGIAFVFSSGDSGYGARYPAASPYVVSVGGTSLYLNDDNTRLSEAVWIGTGSGCSVYEIKPPFQSDDGCNNRTVADISADADPSTGAAIYSTIPYYGKKGWFKVGGTSLAAPLIAGMYALSGGPDTSESANAALYTAPAGSLYDIISGSNGVCSFDYLCNGIAGYDGPSGFGTPIGLGAF